MVMPRLLMRSIMVELPLRGLGGSVGDGAGLGATGAVGGLGAAGVWVRAGN